MAYDERALRGIGGWLAFLIVILGVVSPLRLMVEAIGVWSLDSGSVFAPGANLIVLQSIESLVLAIRLIGSVYLAWRLYKVHTPRTVRVVITGLWLLSLGLVAIELPVVAVATGLPMASLGAEAGVSLFQGAIFATLWTAYLLRSRRVANTYTPDQADMEVFA